MLYDALMLFRFSRCCELFQDAHFVFYSIEDALMVTLIRLAQLFTFLLLYRTGSELQAYSYLASSRCTYTLQDVLCT